MMNSLTGFSGTIFLWDIRKTAAAFDGTNSWQTPAILSSHTTLNATRAMTMDGTKLVCRIGGLFWAGRHLSELARNEQ
jgi:hypothetical protein